MSDDRLEWISECIGGGESNKTNDCVCSIRHIGQFIGNRYEEGSGRIWLDKVTCTGDEKDFTQCGHRGWGRHNCSHSQDVSIACEYPDQEYRGQKT